MEFSIEKDRLMKIVRYCDLIAGSEKKYGFLWLFYDKGVRFFVTDGALKTVFQARGDFPSFERIYQLPILTLKRFLQEKSTDVSVLITLKDMEVQFRCDNELLSLKQNPESGIEKLEYTETLCTFPFKVFIKGIDFATVSLPSLEQIYFVCYDGYFTVVSMDHDTFSIFRSHVPTAPIQLQLPYSSIRHFIKACALIEVGELKIGKPNEKSELFFSTPGALTSLCMKPIDSQDSYYVFHMLHIYEQLRVYARVETSRAQKLLAKALRLSENGVLNISFSAEELEFWISKKTMYYSVKDKIEEYFYSTAAEDSVQFYGKKAKSSLSRFYGKTLYLYRFEDFIGFGDEKKETMVVVKGKKIERSWKNAGMEGITQ